MIEAVVLAAGASARMGTHKLLLPLAGEPLVRRTVRQVCEAGLDDVLVVLGRDPDAVRRALDGLPCRFAVNDAYPTGMGSSFRVAVAHLGGADAAIISLADQPFVTSAQLREIADAYRAHAPLIVCARYGRVTAPPHLFARELFPELADLTEGARPVLERHRGRSITIDFPADRLIDVDTPDDYARAAVRAEGDPPARVRVDRSGPNQI